MKYSLPIIGVVLLLGLAVIFAQSDKNNSAENLTNYTIENGFAIEQLFTSQGCSSCPSADDLLEKYKDKYANNDQVIFLSYHVDYWNRLGWKDPFSKKAYTNLQYEYNTKSVYTPQAVINGKVGFVGSNEAKLERNINEFLKAPAENAITMNNIKKDGSTIQLDYTLSGELEGKELNIVLALDNRKTDIKRGENRSRTLSNSNVVVNETKLANIEKAGSSSVEIPSIVKSDEKLLVVAFLQKSSDLEITGAAKAELKN